MAAFDIHKLTDMNDEDNDTLTYSLTELS